jgi:hydrogenase maturation protease
LKTLIYGYGNPDRQDDGVAWHVLHEIMKHYGLPVSDDLDVDFHDEQRQMDYDFQLQLTPEIADDLDVYDRVCFIDAHTGAVPEEIHLEKVTANFQKSPLTHHLTAASLLSIADTLHHKVPETILVSVRGYEFGFAQSLSAATSSLTRQAAEIIIKWLEEEHCIKSGDTNGFTNKT